MEKTRKEMLNEKQCVILKGRSNGISILLDDNADFELIKDVLRKRVVGSRRFFDGAKATVTFKGRELTDQEEKTLMEIIQFETDMHVAVVDSSGQTTIDNKISSMSPQGLWPVESDTFYYRGGLRGGQTIRQNGSVVVMGDVNAGSEIVSGGNIIVLGTLKGMVHAGATGDKKCFVSALDFQPTQIRIAHVITYIPEGSPQSLKRESGTKGAWAYIQDETVYIAAI